MTPRQDINRQIRRYSVPFYAAMLAVIALLLISVVGDFHTLSTIGAMLATALCLAVAFLHRRLAVRCPSCRNVLTWVNPTGRLFSLPGGYRLCPFCGIDLDEEFEAKIDA